MAAYHFICLNYEPDDEIIMIGYSRGAFAVRCIINLIDEMGILSRRGLADLHPVFDDWWYKSDDELKNLKRRDCHPGPHCIKVCALWDTVDSVGSAGIFGSGSTLGIKRDGVPRRVKDNPIRSVRNVFHALSLHERRSLFQPVIAVVPQDKLEEQKLEQCWFSGYHGDVGGGNSDDVLAHLPLVWMMGKLHPFVDLDSSLFYEVEMDALWQKANSEFTSKFVIAWCIARSTVAD